MTDTLPTPVPLGLDPSFGFGDRIGLATPGHVAAALRSGSGITPVFCQQSIREMERAGRSPERVMEEAQRGIVDAGWNAPFGADADHLKTREDVNRTVAAGFTFFTIDPSEHVNRRADDYGEDEIRLRYTELRDEAPWAEAYAGLSIPLPTGTVVSIDELAMMRAAVKYARAVNYSVELAEYINIVHEADGSAYEIELSIDETEQPTSLAEHYIIAEHCLANEVKLVSLAPRFVGRLEKGVDYIGNLDALERSLRDHAAIAQLLGPYKLSLHSGSDKLSMYTALAKATRGRFHVKTAGTSYLEALRVAARNEPALFRRICEFAREHYEADKATYHVHATLADVPAPAEINGALALEQAYLECWDDVPDGRGFTAPGRQILHCTFGSVLTDADLGFALRRCLLNHDEVYVEILATHFGKHLDALKRGM
jgi:tagaturonate epimerase